MANKRALGSFRTANGLQKFDVDTLWNVLKLFEACDLGPNGIQLPKQPERKNMPYAELRTFLMQGDISEELSDVLFYASKLDSSEGWNCVEDELTDHDKKFDCTKIDTDKTCYAGCALQAWLRYRQEIPDLLDNSFMRLQMSSPYLFAFYPLMDKRKIDTYIQARSTEEKTKTKPYIERLRAKISTYLTENKKGDHVRVKHETYQDEDWFIFRYRENVRYWQEIDEKDSEVVKHGRHIGYHVVIYDRKHGMLRISARQKRLRMEFRTIFGKVLFNDENAFYSTKSVTAELITLTVLKENIMKALDCSNIKEIRWVKLIKFDYEHSQFPLLKHTVNWDPRVALAEEQLLNLLESVRSVSAAYFQYALTSNGKTKKEKKHRLTVKNGNELGFEQDAGTRVILDWLFDRGYFKNLY